MKIKQLEEKTTTLKLSLKEFASKFDIKDEIVDVSLHHTVTDDGENLTWHDPFIEIKSKLESLTERDI